MTHANAKSHITGITTVAVSVTDQARALDFYAGQLGFETRRDMPFGPIRWIEVAPAGAATTIALFSTPGGPAAGVDTGVRLTSADVDADHADLRARGVDVDSEIMRLGSGIPPMFSFRDPDGNRLVIVGQE
jgi:catechol 2,3-dioxygenase-like lactoylglutathione lyase family enzyme